MAPSRARLYCGGAAAGYVCYALYRRWSRGVPLRGATVVISGASAGIGAAPVSYTHLTLPTKA